MWQQSHDPTIFEISLSQDCLGMSKYGNPGNLPAVAGQEQASRADLESSNSQPHSESPIPPQAQASTQQGHMSPGQFQQPNCQWQSPSMQTPQNYGQAPAQARGQSPTGNTTPQMSKQSFIPGQHFSFNPAQQATGAAQGQMSFDPNMMQQQAQQATGAAQGQMPFDPNMMQQQAQQATGAAQGQMPFDPNMMQQQAQQATGAAQGQMSFDPNMMQQQAQQATGAAQGQMPFDPNMMQQQAQQATGAAQGQMSFDPNMMQQQAQQATGAAQGQMPFDPNMMQQQAQQATGAAQGQMSFDPNMMQATGAAQGQMPFDPNMMQQMMWQMMYNMMQQQTQQATGAGQGQMPFDHNMMQQLMWQMQQQQQPMQQPQASPTQSPQGPAAQQIPQMKSQNESQPAETGPPNLGQTPSPLKKPDGVDQQEASKQGPRSKSSGHEVKDQMEEPRRGQESLKEDEPGMQSDTGEEEETNTTVEVTGFSETTSKDAIRYYFEGHRSGGGEITRYQIDEAKQRILITFKDKSVFLRVLSKNTHRVSGNNLTVKEARCRPKPKTPVDKSRILLRNVPETSEETLTYFVEALTDEGHTPSKFLYGKETGTIMALFSQDITDIDMMIKKCAQKPLQKQKITAEKVHFTDCMLVENLPPEIQQDTILLYFENARRSGGGEIVDVEFKKEERNAVVFYKDYTGSAASDATSPPVKIPDPIEVPVNKNILSFVVVNEEMRKALENDMSKHDAAVKWPQEDSEFVTIIPTENQSNPNARDSWEPWEGEVREVLNNFLTNFDTKTVEVLQALWEDVIRKMEEQGMKTTTRCMVKISHEVHTITITGSKNATTMAHIKQIAGVVQELERELKRKKSEVTEYVDDLTMSELRFLQASKFQSHLKSSLPNMTVIITTDTKKVEFKGLPDEIKSARADMFDKLRKLKTNKLKVSPALASFLQDEGVVALLTETLQNKGVVGIIEVDGNDVTISAEKNNIKRATEVFQASIMEQPIKVTPASAFVLETEKWARFKEKQEREATRHLKITVKQVEGQPCIDVVGLPEPVKGAAGKVSSFLQTHAIEEQQVPNEQGVVLFLKEHRKDEMRSIEKELEEFHIKIDFTEQKDGHKLFIRGTSNGVKSATDLVKKAMKGVIQDYHPVRKPGMAKHFTEEGGELTVHSVEGVCHCIITVIDNRKRAESAANPLDIRPLETEPSPPEEPTLQVRATIELDDKKKILVCFDDLTKHEADVIVNPANKDLDHVGGLAKAIVEAGGQEIQEECLAILESTKTSGQLLDADVVATRPGKLRNCKMIVHVVGPEWQGGGVDEEDTLYEAIRNSLLEADKHQFRTIAIPAVSSGLFRFPLPACAKSIVEAVKDFLEESEERSLQEVRFVNNDESTVQAFVEAVQVKFGDKVVMEASNVQPEPGRSSGNVPRRRRRHRVDAIVNTTQNSLNLNTGAVSKAILQQAGDELQKAVNAAKSANVDSVDDGFVFSTGSANLRCKRVVHCVCCGWDNGKGQSEKLLRDILQKCLQEGQKAGSQSIAFPAIGTGGLGFPHDLVAQVMFEEVMKYSSKNPAGSLKEIRFVIYEGDEDSIAAFEKELKRIQLSQAGIDPSSAEAYLEQAGLDVKPPAKAKMGKGRLGRNGTFSGHAAVTGSGNLFCKKIIHAIAPDHHKGNVDTKGWKTVTKACLKKADSERLTSVSFPVFGTGQLASQPSVMATTMLEGIAEFVSEQKETTLSMVRIIPFEKDMVATFKEEMEKKSGQAVGNKTSWFGKLTSLIWSFGATTEPTPQPLHTLKTESTVPDDDVVLAIYAGSKDDVEKAKDMLDKVMSEKSYVDVINDPNISKLTEDEESQINDLKSDDVKIIIKKGKRVSRVQLEGLTKDVLSVRRKIEDILKEIAKRESFKEKAKRIKEDVQWFYVEGDKRYPYDESINALIEEAFQAKKPTVRFETCTEGEKVYIDFASNKEMLEDDSDEEPLDVLRVDRKKEAIKLPDYWEPMDEVDVILVDLKSSDKEHKKVEGAFMDTIGDTNAKIQKIQRVQNPSLFKQYSVLKIKMEAKNSQPVEKNLYHGTEASSVDAINHTGFNRSYSGLNVGAINGNGVYFACKASYSADTNYATPDNDGLRHMYVARVLTGEYCKGKKDIKVPPSKDPNNPQSLIRYDSVCDNVANPTAFVIFQDAQAYPEYLIKFTK
ncbi:positive regulation of interleukin-4-mediated signaling pathway [Branchiostoma belcheri]|nr:positive regulation of interleukin-4-mediated signaling pathway [Branchiostoma belcheri]